MSVGDGDVDDVPEHESYRDHQRRTDTTPEHVPVLHLAEVEELAHVGTDHEGNQGRRDEREDETTDQYVGPSSREQQADDDGHQRDERECGDEAVEAVSAPAVRDVAGVLHLLPGDPLDLVQGCLADRVGLVRGDDHLPWWLVVSPLGVGSLNEVVEVDRHVHAVDCHWPREEPESRQNAAGTDDKDCKDAVTPHLSHSPSPDCVRGQVSQGRSLLPQRPRTGFRSILNTIFDAHNATKPPFLQSEFVYYLCVNFKQELASLLFMTRLLPYKFFGN